MLAGEVLQGERDALLKLIQSMRDEYEATLRNKEEQEAELRGLKVKLWLHDSVHEEHTGVHCCSSLCRELRLEPGLILLAWVVRAPPAFIQEPNSQALQLAGMTLG